MLWFKKKEDLIDTCKSVKENFGEFADITFKQNEGNKLKSQTLKISFK